MPTSSGKSLGFFAAPLLDPSSMFIVLMLFVMLMEDLCIRLSSFPICGGKWPDSTINPFKSQLVIIPTHEAGTSCFYQWAKANAKRIHCVFVDEAHHIIVSDSYCHCFKLFHLLTHLKKPVMLLTTTLPVQSTFSLCKAMQINPLLLRIIHTPTCCSNIRYHVLHVPKSHLAEKTIKVFQSIKLEPHERGVIYTTRIAFMNEIASKHSISTYTSCILADDQANKEEKSCHFLAWRAGQTPWIAATICFGEGIDFPSVHYAIIVEPKEMLLFLQESGHLGHDGVASQAITIWNTPSRSPPADNPDHAGK